MANVVLEPYVVDNGVAALDTASRVYICFQEPTTYNEASTTYTAGYKHLGDGNVFGSAEAASPSGRQIVSFAVTGGIRVAGNTPTHWAVTDETNSRLLARGPLTGGVGMSSGQTWSLGTITIELPSVSAYVGPLDLFGSASLAWGLRALSSAFLGQNIVRVVKIATPFDEQDFAADAVTGLVDTAGIATFLGGEIGRFIKFYDQSGGTNHNVAASKDQAADFSSSPVAARQITDAAVYSSSTTSLTQPYAVSAVALQGESGGNRRLAVGNSLQLTMRIGSYLFIDTNAAEVPRNSTVGTTPSVWFACQGLFNGASSKLLVNGVPATTDGDTGSGNQTTTIGMPVGDWHSATDTNPPSYVREFIMWDADPGDTLRSSIEANQNTYWTLF